MQVSGPFSGTDFSLIINNKENDITFPTLLIGDSIIRCCIGIISTFKPLEKRCVKFLWILNAASLFISIDFLPVDSRHTVCHMI